MILILLMILGAATLCCKDYDHDQEHEHEMNGAGTASIDPPDPHPHSAPLYVDRADPKFLHHRAYRSRENNALGSVARTHGHDPRTRQTGSAPRFDGPRARAWHHHQGASGRDALHQQIR